MSFACIVQLFHHFISLKWRHPGVRRADGCGKLPKAFTSGLKGSLQFQPWKEKQVIIYNLHFKSNVVVVTVKGLKRIEAQKSSKSGASPECDISAGVWTDIFQEDGLIMSTDIAECRWNYGQRMEPHGRNQPASRLRRITDTVWALVSCWRNIRWVQNSSWPQLELAGCLFAEVSQCM